MTSTPVAEIARLLAEDALTSGVFQTAPDSHQLSTLGGLLNLAHAPDNTEHAIRMHEMISRYVRENRFVEAEFQPLESSHVKLICLLYRLKVPKDLGAQTEGTSTALFWRACSDYSDFVRRVVGSYVTAIDKEPFEISRIDQLDSQDISYVRMSQVLASESVFHSAGMMNALYLLLFFDLFSAVQCPQKTPNKKLTERISSFSLKILPHLIGAYRFGELHNELRDCAFRAVSESHYTRTKTKILDSVLSQTDRKEFLEKVNTISKNLESNVVIKSRIKGVCSAFTKSASSGVPISEMWDLFAIRVIIDSPFSHECYRFLSDIEEVWDRRRNGYGYSDYIANPKPNGYQSIHVILVVKGKLVEVQIRTKKMDAVAEHGLASHLSSYKASDSAEEIGKRAISDASRGRQILELHLKKRGLSINDFVQHLQSIGNALDLIPIEHYYEGVFSGKYNAGTLAKQVDGDTDP